MAFSGNPRGSQAVEISTAFTVLAAIIVSLRLYTRFFLVRCPGIEDYGIVLAMLFSIGLTTCIGYQAKWGMGKHIDDLDEDTMQKSLKAFWASLIAYYMSLGLTKSSMILQYRRVFTTKKFQIACWILMAVVVCYSLWTIFGSVFACVPIHAFWTRSGGKCINQFAMWFTNAAINIVTDFALIILPMPVIQSLSLGRRQKIALTSIFAVGGFVCIVSILRLQSLVAISNSTDPTYDNPPAATWSSVETNVGIICSCLPLLRPLMTRFLPGAFTSRNRSQTTGPRKYATITSTRKGTRSRGTEAIEMTTDSPASNEDAKHDIQVITDIEVQVEDRTGGMDVWRTPSNREWEEKGRVKAQSSTDALVKETV